MEELASGAIEIFLHSLSHTQSAQPEGDAVAYLFDLVEVHWEEDVLSVVLEDVGGHWVLEDLRLQREGHTLVGGRGGSCSLQETSSSELPAAAGPSGLGGETSWCDGQCSAHRARGGVSPSREKPLSPCTLDRTTPPLPLVPWAALDTHTHSVTSLPHPLLLPEHWTWKTRGQRSQQSTSPPS